MSQDSMYKAPPFPQGHHGYNLKRLREILGVKQEELAIEFNISQQAVSDWEKQVQISDQILEKIAKVLKIPMEVIKNYNEEIAVKAIVGTFNQPPLLYDQPIVNTVNTISSMMERILQMLSEKNENRA